MPKRDAWDVELYGEMKAAEGMATVDLKGAFEGSKEAVEWERSFRQAGHADAVRKRPFPSVTELGAESDKQFE